MKPARPLIAHVVHRFDVGGLENGVANLINHLPADRFDHAVIALTEVTDFRRRLLCDDVSYRAMQKPSGNGVAVYRDLYRLFRTLRPAIVHTRNIAASEAQLPAALAGVAARVHGEHGWEVADVTGGRASHRLQRRVLRPLIHRHVALSGEIRRCLIERVGVLDRSISQICNCIGTRRFMRRSGHRSGSVGDRFPGDGGLVVGTVGRLSPVKHQRLLFDAFARATRVCGNAELVAAGETGTLVDSDDVEAMATAICGYAIDGMRLAREGRAARGRAMLTFSIDMMVAHYTDLYDGLLAARQGRTSVRQTSVDHPTPSHTH